MIRSSRQKRKAQPTVDSNRNPKNMITCKEGRQSRDWADIGIDLLLHIFKSLLPADILRCRGVCSSWRSITKTYISYSLNSPASREPVFLWPSEGLGWFLDLSRGAEGNLYFNNDQSKNIHCLLVSWVGSSYGYFLFWWSKRLYLFHPRLFPTAALRFPPISMGRKNLGLGIEKAALWADPISETTNCGVVVKHYQYRQLMFAKCGATKFADLEGQDNARSSWLTEMICINNRIYSITDDGHCHRMEAWDCSSTEDAPRKILDFQPSFRSGCIPISRHNTYHLVESPAGDLLLVTIRRPDTYASGRYKVSSKSDPVCRVYKMDFKEKEWVHVDSLGDHALFVMVDHAMSLPAREFPKYDRNTIYFRHYSRRLYKIRLGIFSLEDGSLKKVHTKKLS